MLPIHKSVAAVNSPSIRKVPLVLGSSWDELTVALLSSRFNVLAYIIYLRHV